MDRDSFVLILIAQYKDEIEEALIECEHVYRSSIDYELLDEKLNHIFTCAKVDGLDEAIVWDIIQFRIPSYINYLNSTNLKSASKKAA